MSQPPRTNLAQFNWATLRYDVDDPRVAEFVDNVARMNLIAERMPGFVWRHHYDSKALSRLKRPLPFERTDRFTTTLSVWRDARALADFAFRTIHNRFYEKRALWFEPHKGPYMVMWYVAEGHRPDIDEAVDRAEEFLTGGESDRVFGWDRARQAA